MPSDSKSSKPRSSRSDRGPRSTNALPQFQGQKRLRCLLFLEPLHDRMMLPYSIVRGGRCLPLGTCTSGHVLATRTPLECFAAVLYFQTSNNASRTSYCQIRKLLGSVMDNRRGCRGMTVSKGSCRDIGAEHHSCVGNVQHF